jgi:hypothetical protein
MGYTQSFQKLRALNKGQLSQLDWYLFLVGNPKSLVSQQLPTFLNFNLSKNAKPQREFSESNQSN